MSRGFGSPKYDRSKLREIASKGGKAAHANGTAHEWTPGSEAQAAGRTGGRNLYAERGSEWMAKIGRRGAAARLGRALSPIEVD